MQADKASVPLHSIQVERNVPVPMRDGAILRADIYRPKVEGRYPVIIERVAYELVNRCQEPGEYYARSGYVFVGQNVRGRYASEGEFTPFRDDAWGVDQDGYDTIEWAGVQPWSNGRVGMLGGSYSGLTQYLVGPTRPPHLKTLFVREGGGDNYYDVVFRGGTYQLNLSLEWALEQMLAPLEHETAPAGSEAVRDRLKKALSEIDYWYRYLPLKSCPPLQGVANWYFEDLKHPGDDSYWRPLDLSLKFSEVDVPMAHLGGWFDCFLNGTISCFQGISTQGRTEYCRKNQRLIIGPWIHGSEQVGKRVVGELDFGPEAGFDLDAYRLRWYDHWLKGEENGVMESPAVHFFLMGANRWRDSETWPPKGITYSPMYFRGGTGKSAVSLNSGTLTFEPPNSTEEPDRFLYDPNDPIPSLLMYPNLGPRDYQLVEGRMLTYTSQPLERDLTVIGPVKAVLYASSSAPDSDWVVRLCDVWPDGRSMSVCDGILRARYRNSLTQPELLEPGQAYRFEVDLWSTAQVFQAGHRLRVEVTSSDFPRYDRNLNTGGTFGEEMQGQVAINTILHDANNASHLVLPILP